MPHQADRLLQQADELSARFEEYEPTAGDEVDRVAVAALRSAVQGSRTASYSAPPRVPWDVVELSLVGEGVSVLLARVWLDVLSHDSVDKDTARTRLAAAVRAYPRAAQLACVVPREDYVRRMPPAQQAMWLVGQVEALALAGAPV